MIKWEWMLVMVRRMIHARRTAGMFSVYEFYYKLVPLVAFEMEKLVSRGVLPQTGLRCRAVRH